MKKIPSVFARNYDGDRLIRNEVVPGCEWVLAGEGIATAKWDGTSTLVRAGALFKRYDAKPGRTPPAGFEPAMDPDPVTGHWAGWVPCDREDRSCAYHYEAFDNYPSIVPDDGTYELCGPRVNGNRHGFPHHILVPHGCGALPSWPRTFDAIARAFVEWPEFERAIPAPDDALAQLGSLFTFEGIVFHHADGRMAKVKRKDFGLPWPPAKVSR